LKKYSHEENKNDAKQETSCKRCKKRTNTLNRSLRGKRVDNRGLLDYRPLTITPNIIEKAEGSALVKLGDTQVIAALNRRWYTFP
jgi:ribosomal RNA-processing protein RRP42 (EC 3.1.13.-)